jgi:hypothetical protein
MQRRSPTLADHEAAQSKTRIDIAGNVVNLDLLAPEVIGRIEQVRHVLRGRKRTPGRQAVIAERSAARVEIEIRWRGKDGAQHGQLFRVP